MRSSTAFGGPPTSTRSRSSGSHSTSGQIQLLHAGAGAPNRDPASRRAARRPRPRGRGSRGPRAPPTSSTPCPPTRTTTLFRSPPALSTVADASRPAWAAFLADAEIDGLATEFRLTATDGRRRSQYSRPGRRGPVRVVPSQGHLACRDDRNRRTIRSVRAGDPRPPSLRRSMTSRRRDDPS